MAGADLRTVAEWLRDKTLHMAMRYSHLAPDLTLDAVGRTEAKCNDDLIKEGRQLRSLCGGVVSAGPPCVFDIELKVCREE